MVGRISKFFFIPTLIFRVPLNESWGVPHICHNVQQRHHSVAMYHLIHSLDTTRPVISNDGWELTVTDIYGVHNYTHGHEKEIEKFNHFKKSLSTREDLLQSLPAGRRIYTEGFSHQGEPILLTEFGGIGYKAGKESGWGYTSVTNEKEFIND